MDFHEMNIVLLGKTGHGKSATGNTIIGEIRFPEGKDLNSCTQMVERQIRHFENVTVHVFDTPGLYETDLTNQPDHLELDSAFQQMDVLFKITSKTGGIHAFFLVLNITQRFTTEEFKTVTAFENIFGDDVFSKHGVLVFTHGDLYENNFSTFCTQQIGFLKEFIEKFQGRVLLINNKGEFSPTYERERSGKRMIGKALQLKRSVAAYTLNDYKNNEQNRSRFYLETNLERIRKTINAKIKSLEQDIDNVSTMTSEIKAELTFKVDLLKAEIKHESNGTELLDMLKYQVQLLESKILKKESSCQVL